MTDFSELINLASARLGATAVAANDEFFAEKENLVKDSEPVFLPDEYTDRGKWMDGWETRRRRTPGHDWCIVRLGLRGRPRGAVVDTRHFVGNFPPELSLEGADLGNEAEDFTAVTWHPLLARADLDGGAENHFEIEGAPVVTHVRLNIFPDGGVARLRLYGEVVPDWAPLQGREIDLACLIHGTRVVACSDMFFGPRHNLILPGPSLGMHDGWETRRRRGPGNDWAVLRFERPGLVRRVEIDTSFFRGNAPGRASLEYLTTETWSDPTPRWQALLPEVELEPDRRHPYASEVQSHPPMRCVRLSIFPDGGVARLRLWGEFVFPRGASG